MAHSIDEVTLIDSFPTVNSDEQGEQPVPAQDEVPLSRWGRGRVIDKKHCLYGDTDEAQKEVNRAGSCPTRAFGSDQGECITSITGSIGAAVTPYNAGYDQRNPLFPERSGQHRDQGRSTLPPDWFRTEDARRNPYSKEQQNSLRNGYILGTVACGVLLGVMYLIYYAFTKRSL